MGTVLQTRAVSTSVHNVLSNDRTKTKSVTLSSEKAASSVVQKKQGRARRSLTPAEERVPQLKRERCKSHKTSAIVNTAACPQRHTPKSQVSSSTGVREKDHKWSCQQNKERHQIRDGSRRNHSTVSQPLAGSSWQDEPRCLTDSIDRDCVYKGVQRDDPDSGSDLSESERLPLPLTTSTPPQLNLRAEVIKSCDRQSSLPGARGLSHADDSYPDFLPPPFNSWSLRQLSVYLNTDARDTPRPRPVGQLERYLDRLLQLEWHQIQTLQEESKFNTPLPASHHRTHASPTSHLSTPKTILQCQRAFPLALLSSLANLPSSHVFGNTSQYCCLSFSNGPCRNSAHHHSRLSPLLERKRKTSVVSKRSSSESRAHLSEYVLGPVGNRLGNPQNVSIYIKRMQAVGNIRNPGGPMNKPQPVTRNSSVVSSSARRPGLPERSDRGREFSVSGYRRKGMDASTVALDTTLPGTAAIKDDFKSSKDSMSVRPCGKQKHVEFAKES